VFVCICIYIYIYIYIVASTGAHGMADSKDGCMIVEGISVKADKTRKESRGRARVKES